MSLIENDIENLPLNCCKSPAINMCMHQNYK